MRLAIAQPPLWDTRATVDLVSQAETLGFSSAWIADQTFHADPYVILGSAASETSEIRLGLGLTNPTTRHPSVTARAAAAVAGLTGPRFALGIGAGNTRELLGPLGLLADKPARSVAEAIEIIKVLLDGKSATFSGEYFSITDISLEINLDTPVPLFVGGRGERILTIAGQQADGVILSVAALERTWEIVAAAADAAGRDPDAIERVGWGEVVIDPTPDELENQRHTLAHVLGRAPIPGLLVLGLDPELITRIKESYETDGIPAAAKHVSKEMMSRHMVIGSRGDCLERLNQMSASGVHEYAVLMKTPDFQKRADHIARLAKDIIPELA